MFLNQVRFINSEVNIKPRIRVRYQKYKRAQMSENSLTAPAVAHCVGSVANIPAWLVTPGAREDIPCGLLNAPQQGTAGAQPISLAATTAVWSPGPDTRTPTHYPL